MKKIALFAAMLTIMFAAIESTLHAQCPVPVDFPGQPFIAGGQPIQWTDPCGCVITVHWCWRTVLQNGIPVYYDVEITSIESDCPAGVSPCASVDEIADVAFRTIVAVVNPWNAVVPCCPESNDYWRFFGAGCLSQWWYDPLNNIYRRDDCGGNACWQILHVCWNCEGGIGGQEDLQITETFQATGVCDEFYVTPYSTTVPCISQCE